MNRRLYQPRIAVCAALMCLLLGACGQMGPLQQPPPEDGPDMGAQNAGKRPQTLPTV